MAEMSPRVQRVADQIQRELATLIQLEVNDPRVGMVSVTGVEVSRDIAHARVFVTVLNSMTGDADQNAETLEAPGPLDRLEIDENVAALNKAAGFLRSLLAKRLAIRTVPKLRFFFDGSVQRGNELSRLIDQAIESDQPADQATEESGN